MKSCKTNSSRLLPIIFAIVFFTVFSGFVPVMAQNVVSLAIPSNSNPAVTTTFTVPIVIDMSATSHKLGSFTGTLTFNPAVISYTSDTGITAPFTGLVNTSSAGSGSITFNGAYAVGGTGSMTVLTLTFTAMAAGTSPLNLEFSAMAAALTFTNLLPILTITDGSVTVPSANSAPTASAVSISGTAQVGQLLTGNYTYNDADSDPQGTSTFRWLRNGTAIAGATAKTYTLVAADAGTNIVFEVTPVAQTGVLVGTPVQSAPVGPVAPASAAPYATNVNISGTAQVGQLLTGNYTYNDINGDPEGTSTFRWLRNGTAIAGATAKTYTLVAADATTNIVFEVTPVAQTGVLVGTPVQSAPVGPVAAITYTLTAGNDGHGTVTLTPPGGTYASGTTVTLTPIPTLGYQFSSWSGANAGDVTFSGGVYRIVINANKVVTANFIEAEYIPTVEFWATPTRGYPALSVNFMDASEGEPTAWLWEFGDGQTSTEQNPRHVYWQPGKYSVTLTVTTQFGTFSLEKEQFIYVNGFEFCPCTMLDLIDNSTSFASENWNNAIDQDASGLDGTVTAGGTIPYAIFKFHDNKTKSINKIRLMTNTDVGMQDRWMVNFDVLISTTGPEDADFSLLMSHSKKGGGWEEFTCTPQPAKYIKLVITNPNSGWRQLGEFEVCVIKEYPEITKSTIKATSPHTANGIDASLMTITLKKYDGTALTGLSAEDFYLYSYSGAFTHSAVKESSTPGVYTTSISTIEPDAKQIKVIVHCMLIGSATINFSAPVMKESALTFIEGSTAFRNEGWDNLIDSDEEGWDGTATVGGAEPYAIFAFADGGTKAIQQIALMMDTGVGFPARWLERFRIQASITGKASSDFVTVYDGIASGGAWQHFLFPAFNAKYLKLIVDFPAGTWRQLGEMKVYTTTLAMTSQQANELTQIGDIPQEWSVSNNYPNPFNPETHVQFSVPEAGHVTAIIYNMLGQKVRTLLDNEVQAGTHQMIWDSRSESGETMPSGVYYMRFDFSGRFVTKKVVLMK